VLLVSGLWGFELCVRILWGCAGPWDNDGSAVCIFYGCVHVCKIMIEKLCAYFMAVCVSVDNDGNAVCIFYGCVHVCKTRMETLCAYFMAVCTSVR
jgi:hypothetical protein